MVDVYTLFDNFIAAANFKQIIQSFQHICTALDIDPTDSPNIYKSLRQINDWRAQKLWKLLDKKCEQAEYKKQTATNRLAVLIIGAGPCGLRMAIECALLGSRVVLVEQRDKFSRNNVLHLWEFVIHDLKSFGAKIFFPKFCTGSIEHISIRQLQCILLKISLCFGVQIFEGVTYVDLRIPQRREDGTYCGYRAHLQPASHILCDYEFDVLIGADGKRNTVKGFPREEMRGKLAIGITANFVNRKTHAEERVPEISGVAYIFNQAFFKEMQVTTGVDLENIVYYKDETHYFVMCAKKQSLLDQGVIMKDCDDVSALLSADNVDQEQLCRYAASAANFATNGKLPVLEYATNHHGRPDIAMFDFTSLFSSKCSVRLLERHGKYLLLGIVGDSLHEPFWPTGSGCARGFLGVMDTAWLIREYGMNSRGPLEMIAERESTYRLLAQVTKDNLHKQLTRYTIDPRTRYVSLELTMRPEDVQDIVNTDNPRMVDIKQPIGLSNKGSVHDYPGRLKYAVWKFCHHALAPYKLKLFNMNSGWSDGLALCALMAKFRSETMDYFVALSMEDEVTARIQLVFDCVGEHLGIDPPCDPEAWLTLREEGKLSYIGGIVGVIRTDLHRVQALLITPRSAASKRRQDAPRKVDASKAKKSEQIHKMSEQIRELYGHNMGNEKQDTPVNWRERTRSDGGRATSDNEFRVETNPALEKALDPAYRYKTLQEQQEEDEKHITKRPQVSSLNPELLHKVEKIVTGELVEEQTAAARAERERKATISTRKMDKNDLKEMEDRLENVGMGRLVDKSLRAMTSREEKLVRTFAADARKEAMSGFRKEQEKEKFKDVDGTLERSEEILKRRDLAGVDGVSKWRTASRPTKLAPPQAPPKTVSLAGRAEDGSVIIRPVAPVLPKRQTQSMPDVDSLYESVNPRRQQKCQLCEKVVYLAERMQVESMFLHRHCFKCAFCGLPLRLGECGQDRELEHHYKNKFFCRTHLRLSLREKMARIERNERRALSKRNSQDEGSASDSSKENAEPAVGCLLRAEVCCPREGPSSESSAITGGSSLSERPAIRVPSRPPATATLSFFSPEQLRDSTMQRLRDPRRGMIMTSPVEDLPGFSATPERAEFNAQGSGNMPIKSLSPSRPVTYHASDSEDEEEDVLGESTANNSDENPSRSRGDDEEGINEGKEADESLSDEEELLAEEDLQELERTVLEIADENPDDAIGEDLARSVLHRINSRRLEASTVLTPPEKSETLPYEQFYTPCTPCSRLRVGDDDSASDEYHTPNEHIRTRQLALEQLRTEARERAKLKSDAELGIGSRSEQPGDRRSVPCERLLARIPRATRDASNARAITVSPPRIRSATAPTVDAPIRRHEFSSPRSRTVESMTDAEVSSTERNSSIAQAPALPATAPPRAEQQGLLARLFSPEISRRVVTVPSHPTPIPGSASGMSCGKGTDSVHSESQKEIELRSKTNIWSKLKQRRNGSPAGAGMDVLSESASSSEVPCAAVAPSPRHPVLEKTTIFVPGVPPTATTSSSPLIATGRNLKIIQKRAEKVRRQHDEDKRRSAQDIQRGLEETEIRLEKVTERGRQVEGALKNDPLNKSLLEEWRCLTQEWEILLLKEDDLRLRAKEMQLEHRYKELALLLKEDSESSDDDKANMLREMLSVIDQKKLVKGELEESRTKWKKRKQGNGQSESLGDDFRLCRAIFLDSQ